MENKGNNKHILIKNKISCFSGRNKYKISIEAKKNIIKYLCFSRISKTQSFNNDNQLGILF